MKVRPHSPCFTSGQVLDGVERWVEGCLLVRETESLPGLDSGRIDGLLVPVDSLAAIHKTKVRMGLIGVEVKIHRSDFLRGLKAGQFDRYAQALSGLYIATTGIVCKTREVPRAYGHLVVNRRPGYGSICVCKRHPQWSVGPLTVDDMWAVLFRVVERLRDDASRDKEQYANWKNVAGAQVMERVMGALARVEAKQAAKLGTYE